MTLKRVSRKRLMKLYMYHGFSRNCALALLDSAYAGGRMLPKFKGKDIFKIRSIRDEDNDLLAVLVSVAQRAFEIMNNEGGNSCE